MCGALAKNIYMHTSIFEGWTNNLVQDLTISVALSTAPSSAAGNTGSRGVHSQYKCTDIRKYNPYL